MRAREHLVGRRAACGSRRRRAAGAGRGTCRRRPPSRCSSASCFSRSAISCVMRLVAGRVAPARAGPSGRPRARGARRGAPRTRRERASSSSWASRARSSAACSSLLVRHELRGRLAEGPRVRHAARPRAAARARASSSALRARRVSVPRAAASFSRAPAAVDLARGHRLPLRVEALARLGQRAPRRLASSDRASARRASRASVERARRLVALDAGLVERARRAPPSSDDQRLQTPRRRPRAGPRPSAGPSRP